ncbi:protein-disulfide reductase DsbD domain-containing protein, partial [Bacteroides graminisolvens]|uniref:protein-disulfide reductase DsbD domain-containing protein n=1 Tax=Bacteroides graminisolvens TaxID=477666 RepID=UPI0023F4CCC7
MKKICLWLFVFTLAALNLQAQIKEPVKFKTSFKSISPTEAEIIFSGTIDNGWHVYSTNLPDGGPISATFNVDKQQGVQPVGKFQAKGKEVSTFDKLFEMQVRYFSHAVQFVQKVKITGATYHIEGYLEYGACDDESCLPPTQVPFKFSGKGVEGGAQASSATTADKTTQAADEAAAATAALNVDSLKNVNDSSSVAAVAVGTTDLWAPVINELHAFGETTSQKDMSWIYIFITGFLGGLLALFTPCVWPIIPMTVSFFLKRS